MQSPGMYLMTVNGYSEVLKWGYPPQCTEAQRARETQLFGKWARCRSPAKDPVSRRSWFPISPIV